ncbi:MAG: hypothetical protein ACYC2P_12920, partial [Paludibacteraceae bacterium]
RTSITYYSLPKSSILRCIYNCSSSSSTLPRLFIILPTNKLRRMVSPRVLWGQANDILQPRVHGVFTINNDSI